VYIRIVDFLDRQAMLVQIMCLEEFIVSQIENGNVKVLTITRAQFESLAAAKNNFFAVFLYSSGDTS